jgi:hypothetical protein
MNEALTDTLLARMSLAHRTVLASLGVFAVFVGVGVVVDCLPAHSGWPWIDAPWRLVSLLLFGPMLILLLVAASVILVGSLCVCYYVFRTGLHEVGVAYAISHLLLCLTLNIFGVLLIPLLLRSDIARRNETAGT